MASATNWRLKYRKLQSLLLLGFIATSAVIIYWDLGAKIPVDNLQFGLKIGTVIPPNLARNGQSSLELDLYVYNPLNFATPGLLIEAPHIYVWSSILETELYTSRIDCRNGTLTSFTGKGGTWYVALCGTDPVSIGPNQSVVFPINLTFSRDDYAVDDWVALHSQNISIVLLAFLTIRPFYSANSSPAPPFRVSASDCWCLDWIVREFRLTVNMTHL